jgi:monoterpene epsilon-lactone hydrolase
MDMPSAEFDRFVGFLRMGQERMDAPKSVEEMRQTLEQMVMAMHPAPSFATYAPLVFDGAYTEVTSVTGSRQGKAVLYLHGGAFKMGGVVQDRHLTAELAWRTEANVVAVEYGLAPENKFPVALEQCIAAYHGLLATGYEASDIVVAGISAGGTLALAAMLALKDRDLPLPGAVVVVSAGTYLDSAKGSHTSNRATDLVLGNVDMAADVMDLYAPGEDPLNPYISPLYGDYTGVPPMLVVVGTSEIFYDDAVLVAEKARAAGVEVELVVGEGMPHAYPAFFDAFPEAEAAFNDICVFASTRLAN